MSQGIWFFYQWHKDYSNSQILWGMSLHELNARHWNALRAPLVFTGIILESSRDALKTWIKSTTTRDHFFLSRDKGLLRGPITCTCVAIISRADNSRTTTHKIFTSWWISHLKTNSYRHNTHNQIQMRNLQHTILLFDGKVEVQRTRKTATPTPPTTNFNAHE